MTILITHINKYPEYLGNITEWYMSFWGKNYPQRTQSEWKDYIGRNDDAPPATLIAIDTSKSSPLPIGTVSLKLDGINDYETNTAWLSALYVIPEYRGKNIASELIKEIIKIAGKHHNDLYLFTRAGGHIYKKLGWHTIDISEYQREKVYVMKKSIILNLDNDKK